MYIAPIALLKTFIETYMKQYKVKIHRARIKYSKKYDCYIFWIAFRIKDMNTLDKLLEILRIFDIKVKMPEVEK